MSDIAAATNEAPRASVTVVYLGPVAPHWDVRSDYGEKVVVDEFHRRLNARLMLVPPHDPQFRRNRERVITDLKRISKPGRRVYARKDRLPRVLGGLGTAILSTSTGIITSRQAAERGVGGEVIAFVW